MAEQAAKTFGIITSIVSSSVDNAVTLCMADGKELLVGPKLALKIGFDRAGLESRGPVKMMYVPEIDQYSFTWATEVEIVTDEDQEKAVRGLRYTEGKLRMERIPPQFLLMIAEIMTEDPELRLDLIPKKFIKEVAIVYTEGTKGKYPARNWEKGMPWSNVIGPLWRHWLRWLSGKTRDKELPKCHHLAMISWQCAALMEYEDTCPELDDRSEIYRDWPSDKSV